MGKLSLNSSFALDVTILIYKFVIPVCHCENDC